MRSEWTREELIEALAIARERLGKIPSKRDLDRAELVELGVPGYSTYCSHFGSWRKALTHAFPEAEVNRHVRKLADDATMRADMRRVAQALGRPPTVQDMIKWGAGENIHHPNTYIRHYGSWKRAIEACLPLPPF